MKKTLLITCQFPPDIGGVETHLYNIAKRLLPDKLVVLAPEGEYIPIKKVYRNKKCVKFDCQQKYRTVRAPFYHHHKFIWPRWLPLLKKTEQTARENNVKQLIAGQVLPVGTAARIISHRLDIPYDVFTYAYDIEVAKNHWRHRHTLKQVLSDARHIFTISDDTKKRITSLGIPEKQIVKITPGLDFTEFVPEPKTLQDTTSELRERYQLADKQVILTIGRLVARKGQDIVIRALPTILREFPQAHYVIAGKGEYEEALKNLVKKLGLEANVTFTGKFAESEKAAWYNLCDIFVMVSRIENSVDIEGFGIVYLEANALGKPVLGARVGGVPDAVADNISGLLIDDPTDSAAVAAALIKLLSDPNLRLRLGRAGQKRVRRQFDWNNLVSDLKKYL